MGSDTSVKKVMAKSGPHGDQEQTYLVSGKRVSLRLWEKEPPRTKEPTKRSYEMVGYVISGRAELTLEGQTIKLEPGDSWIVLADAEHAYRNLRNIHCDSSNLTASASAWLGRSSRSIRRPSRLSA